MSRKAIKSPPDAIIGILGIPIAAWLYIIAPEQAPGVYAEGVQPWLFPRLVLILFVALCVLLIWKSMQPPPEPRPAEAKDADTGGEALASRDAVLNAVVPISLTLLYVLGTVWIGYLAATLIVSALYMLFLGASIRVTVSVAIVGTAVIYYVFGDLLNIPLPLGRLFQ